MKEKETPISCHTRGLASDVAFCEGTGYTLECREACVCSEMQFPVWAPEFKAENVVQRRKEVQINGKK